MSRLVAPSPEAHAPGTIAHLSESALIARIRDRLPAAPPWLVVGIGDDAAVVEPERNRLDVLSVDTLVEGIHFDRAFVPAEAIGHRALAANLSDLAAMGAAPRLALLALALPASLLTSDFDGLVTGVAALASLHRLHVAGGNLTRSPGPMVIDITVSGTVKRRQVLTRSGARAGDDLYVSGTIGAAAAGLMMLNSSATAATDADGGHRFLNEQSSRSARASSAVLQCVERYLYPTPRVRLGVLLGRTRAASACIDLSDGFSDGMYRIAESSGVGVTVEADALPIETDTRSAFEAHGGDAVAGALEGGDDYELLFAARPRARGRVAAAARQAGVPVARVGMCTEAREVVLRRAGMERPLLRCGYRHFGA
jgi:thiamine-monophosphate kinase